MPKNSKISHGGNDFRVDLDISDYTDEITTAIHQATRRALAKIGLQCERYAKQTVHVITGRLRNSITHEVVGSENAVYIGSNVSYAGFEEEGTSKRPAHPFLRPAAQDHIAEYVQIMKNELKNGG